MKYFGLHIIKEDNNELMISQYNRDKTMELHTRENAEQEWVRKYAPIAYPQWNSPYVLDTSLAGGLNIIEVSRGNGGARPVPVSDFWTWEERPSRTMTVTSVNTATGTVTLDSSYGLSPITRLETTIDSGEMNRRYAEELRALYTERATLREAERRRHQAEVERERLEAERNRERRPWDRLTNFFR
jgi:hypothetical protein